MPETSLAARFAAKEAIAKALGAPGGHALAGRDRAPRSPARSPWSRSSAPSPRGGRRPGVDRFHLSISHDAGIASAVVVAERD